MPDAPHGVYLAFDFGTVRIGLAVGHSQSGTSKPLIAVRNNSGTPLWQDIDDTVNEWTPIALVVGLALTEDGEDQEITHHTRGFAKRLKKRYELPIFFADEQYSSIQAQQEMKNMRARGQRGKTRKEDIDTLSAALILERWFSTDPFAQAQS